MRHSYTRWSLLLADGIENVTWPGNLREIDLGLDLVALNAAGARVFGQGLGFAGDLKVRAHLHRFVLFHGTGVRLLLGDAH
jgi:hypothetical protein